MMGRFGRVFHVALAASLSLLPAPSIAAGEPTWNVIEATEGGSCGASTDGSVLIATPDGKRYGIIVSNVTVGDYPDREIRVDGVAIPYRWTQLRTTAFTPLDDPGLAKIAAARSLQFPWPEKAISLPTAGLPAVLAKLKACGEAIAARRVAGASSAPAGAGASDPEGPLVLTLECDGQGVWTAAGSVSSGIPGDVTHDREVTYAAGGQGRVRLHFGPEGNTVSFPATFPRQASGRPLNVKGVEVGPDRLVAKARGLLGTSTVLTVDRRSGEVNFDLGGVSFSGTCRKVDEAAASRKF
jgi:hypothetical protein